MKLCSSLQKSLFVRASKPDLHIAMMNRDFSREEVDEIIAYLVTRLLYVFHSIFFFFFFLFVCVYLCLCACTLCTISIINKINK